MKVFVAGASGAIGRQLVPMMVESGHEVIGMTRSESKMGVIREAGAEPVVADALDAAALEMTVRAAEPEVVVHELTAIPTAVDAQSLRDLRNAARAWCLERQGEGAPRLGAAPRLVP